MKIRNAEGRQDGGSGYTRVLGNADLGQLISRIQSTVISNGTELERIIVSLTNTIPNLELFIDNVTDGSQEDGVYLCQKKILKKSRYAIAGIEPDLLVFVVERRRVCKVIELKDGDNFDTKKSASEREHLEQFATSFGAQIPFVTEFYICSFNQEDKDLIQIGFKNKFEPEHIMTGRELCTILHISYDDIVNTRHEDMRDNFDYFISELVNIPEVKEKILELI
ncbi:MAG: restriction endonuclease [Candidatus Fimenecus sp.]